MRNSSRFVAALAGLLIVLGFVQPATAQTKAFSIETLATTATVYADGSMDVVEQVVYRFQGGPFSNGYRTFAGEWLDNIEEFTASDEVGPLPVLIPGASDRKRAFQWKYSQPGSGTHRFTLRYRVRDAVAIGPDVAELYWQFVGDEHEGIGSVQVHVDLPGTFSVAAIDEPDDNTSVVRAWGHGPLDGFVAPSPAAVELTSPSLAGRTFFEARVVIPRTAFTGSSIGEPRLPTILAEEREFQATGIRPADADKGKLGRKIAPIAAPILGLGAIVTCLSVWRKHGREYAASFPTGDYWREPMDEPPAIVAATKAWGGVDGKAMASTLVDLAQRGHLTIVEEKEQRFGPDKTFYRFRRSTPRARAGTSLPFARSLIGWWFRRHVVEINAEGLRQFAERRVLQEGAA